MRASRSISRRFSLVARRAMLGASLLAAANACSRLRHGQDEPTEPVEPAQIVFVNESLEQADVFASAQGGETVRIGTIQAGRTETLTVPQQFVSRGTVIIVVRLLARSGTIRTGPISISPGDRYQVRLPVNGNVLSVLPAS
jgi:hypothetical protein